jgi:hypothetical protein
MVGLWWACGGLVVGPAGGLVVGPAGGLQVTYEKTIGKTHKHDGIAQRFTYAKPLKSGA